MHADVLVKIIGDDLTAERAEEIAENIADYHSYEYSDDYETDIDVTLPIVELLKYADMHMDVDEFLLKTEVGDEQEDLFNDIEFTLFNKLSDNQFTLGNLSESGYWNKATRKFILEPIQQSKQVFLEKYGTTTCLDVGIVSVQDISIEEKTATINIHIEPNYSPVWDYGSVKHAHNNTEGMVSTELTGTVLHYSLKGDEFARKNSCVGGVYSLKIADANKLLFENFLHIIEYDTTTGSEIFDEEIGTESLLNNNLDKSYFMILDVHV